MGPSLVRENGMGSLLKRGVPVGAIREEELFLPLRPLETQGLELMIGLPIRPLSCWLRLERSLCRLPLQDSIRAHTRRSLLPGLPAANTRHGAVPNRNSWERVNTSQRLSQAFPRSGIAGYNAAPAARCSPVADLW